MSDVTRLIDAAAAGNERSAAQLLPLVYDQMRALAVARLAAEPAGQTLQPTALVHEAYLRLVGPTDTPRWSSRGHFFAAAAEAMRRILVENARRKKRERHGGRLRRVDLDGHEPIAVADPDSLLALDDALTALAAEDEPAASVARLHLFAGMSLEEAGDALHISRATAYRQWTYARARFRLALGGGDEAASR